MPQTNAPKEVIERIETNDLRYNLTSEQSEHCRDKRENAQPAVRFAEPHKMTYRRAFARAVRA